MKAQMHTDIVVEPQGPFSWSAACEVLSNFAPVRHHWRGSSEVVRRLLGGQPYDYE